MKKAIAFDLDGTLADSKSTIDDRMAALLEQLLVGFEVCIISGGKFEQFEAQLLNQLHIEEDLLRKMHIMPTCGTRYYRYVNGAWHQQYAEDFNEDEKKRIISVLEQGVDALGLREKQTWGEIIEDRGSQITFSALGQDIVSMLGPEGVKKKEAWDPTSEKKMKLRNYVADLLPEFEVRVGGGTSVDITKPGIDKAYGMQKLMAQLTIEKKDILFIGDRLTEGGNDYPVMAMGIDSIQISKWQETALVVETLIKVSAH